MNAVISYIVLAPKSYVDGSKDSMLVPVVRHQKMTNADFGPNVDDHHFVECCRQVCEVMNKQFGNHPYLVFDKYVDDGGVIHYD